MNNPKEEFINLLRSTNREGMDYVIEDLEALGFFKAPASTRFHLNNEGGLMEHSLNVCHVGLKLRETMIAMDPTLEPQLPRDSVIIATLLHDVCKSDVYRPVIKKQKNAFGMWEDVPGYEVDYSNFPMGHGEKSVIMLLQSGLDITDDEMIAIRWHMSAWDLAFQSAEMKGHLNAAKDKCPLLSIVQGADNLASALLERKM